MQIKEQPAPILLFNDECGVCRTIANWVKKQAQEGSGVTPIVVRPIGQDPEELRALNQGLNIWDAYATIHLLMPDGSMKLGGEAVAEVLRNLPSKMVHMDVRNQRLRDSAIPGDIEPGLYHFGRRAPGVWL
jgi:predicted DCC family thiol-disulfide oxidoreductase YuxK